MNLMVLKRFKNELTILISLLFVLYAFFYKFSSKKFVDEKKSEIISSIKEIDRVEELKKLWKNNAISKKANRLRNIVSRNKVKLFKKSSGKVLVNYKSLSVRELNQIIKFIMNNSFQISKLKIDRVGKENYSMELVCRW